jgi:hypothetical protein
VWSVPAGERLVYALALDETGVEQKIAFGCTLALVAEPAGADGLAAFTCEVTRLRCAFGAQETGGGITFDSDRPDPKHPLAMLQAAVGMPFTCALDPATGDVARLAGFRAIRDAIAARPRDALLAVMSPAQVNAFVNGIFSDAYMRAALDALTHVRGDGRVVRWRAAQTAAPAAHAPGVQAFEAFPGEPVGCALRALSTSLRADDRFLYAGAARYEAGRLVGSRLRQELVDAHGRSCVTVWSMTLEAPSGGGGAR